MASQNFIKHAGCFARVEKEARRARVRVLALRNGGKDCQIIGFAFSGLI